MKTEVLNNLDKDFVKYINDKLDEFNFARWEVKEVKPLGIKVTDSKGEIVAGSASRSFGYWLLLDTLWVSESMRGQDLGTKILAQTLGEAKKRGCKYVLLDTLNFQARPFYEKHGFKVQWTQNNYPNQSGCKYFMVKEL
jgi:GNAT superfamily N-acetyltransferase